MHNDIFLSPTYNSVYRSFLKRVINGKLSCIWMHNNANIFIDPDHILAKRPPDFQQF